MKLSKIYKFIRNNYFYFFIYSFIGWIYEFIKNLIIKNQFVNSGFLFGPYLPLYGISAVILLFLLQKLVNKEIKLKKINITPIVIFALIFFLITIIEYISHYILDECFNIVLWNYSKDALNINGRICFRVSRNFAILGTICLYFLQPIINFLLNILSEKKKNIIFIILLIIILLDFSFKLIIK